MNYPLSSGSERHADITWRLEHALVELVGLMSVLADAGHVK